MSQFHCYAQASPYIKKTKLVCPGHLLIFVTLPRGREMSPRRRSIGKGGELKSKFPYTI